MSCLGVYLSSEYLLILVKNLNGKIFKFMLLRLPKNAFVSQKIESIHFLTIVPRKTPPRFLSSLPKQTETNHFHQAALFEMSQKMPKIKLLRKLVTGSDHLCNLFLHCTF